MLALVQAADALKETGEILDLPSEAYADVSSAPVRDRASDLRHAVTVQYGMDFDRHTAARRMCPSRRHRSAP